MGVIDVNPIDILSDEKKNKNISIYDISYKTFMGSMPLRIRFNNIDGFIIITMELDI